MSLMTNLGLKKCDFSLELRFWVVSLVVVLVSKMLENAKKTRFRGCPYYPIEMCIYKK